MKADENNHARFIKDKLYVKGRLQEQFLEPILPEVTPNDVHEHPICESEPVSDAGSTFRGYATQVSSLRDVSISRQDILLRDGVATANHIITAFRIQVDDEIEENFLSDRDYGAGLELLKHMRENDHINCAMFATRICTPGFKHLGNKRFEYIKQVCTEATEHLE